MEYNDDVDEDPYAKSNMKPMSTFVDETAEKPEEEEVKDSENVEE